MTRIAVLQMTSGIAPVDNAAAIVDAIREAKRGGAEMLFTPEMSGLLDRDRRRAQQNIAPEGDDCVLAAVREAAAEQGIWVALGSLAIALDGADDGARWANRSFLIGPDGAIAARYDKMHMFDVDLSSGESWRESNAYRPGDAVVTAESPVGRLGLAICYDLRFPALFEALGNAACDVIAVPAAFTVPTGRAHWHVLQRARAIEASAFVVAAAQVGEHADGRRTYGHSLVVDPWGEVLLDMGGDDAGLGFAQIDRQRITDVRQQVPSLANRRKIPD
ncbi:carbon-nitrogen hydrolase family protein [Pelagerythrobacter marensis]|uniref:Nitrilase/cyanide hydratase and apolipoprotein N-acyltransferase n=1 Tax=Pelagerythrobacter marensis TaxID=543877 RepID=A0A0G3X800_9SPHN|nr:carbon-nitrogen hydrolase family protein [Pelagerythrobacter marensis]AKM06746.1 Nitrilase/cyanide hydratase and apolipoprotein N-acyltransferase [Pelagerythrobacter marensis]